MDALAESGYMWREVGIVNMACGVCLLLNRWSALAAAALLPITLNIFLLHLWRLDAFGLTIGVPVFGLNLALLFGIRAKYANLLAAK
jgi:putative oxidoreductase